MGGAMKKDRRRLYRIDCHCGLYYWRRYPPKAGRFMRCRECRRPLGDFEVELVRTQAGD